MPHLNKPQPRLRPNRRSPAPHDAISPPSGTSVFLTLDARLTQALGGAEPPASLQRAGALLQALRQTFDGELRRWCPLVPDLAPDLTMGRVRDPARELGLDLSDLRVLYRALRVVWLAELVFGERELAHRWLSQPKRCLQGRVPLLLCQHGRYAAMIEQWLVNIDEGNGP
ncbi:MbcA/ParS/Xre antitoxin family protein [Achromobacter seleniivolatilans]|uniref:MbcA/ParS/Xre antitoxin family protein n=1 Tax=Achromobacter seleniivolatilans TaxID=3047478 RepID=A0ABY9M1F9_9BURK|nr:MbcA/ParS/Xre antitoxin family protein [Achromobacter sp. R39]WMD20831.1 MbcA/ParS/Xre antitoxin family protein [Achromobacter sp. R39]